MEDQPSHDRRGTEQRAVTEVARRAHGGLTFHQLRHSYGIWLMDDGVPINDAQVLMGHEKASTTLDFYVHPKRVLDSRVDGLFADFLLTPDDDEDSNNGDEDQENGA